MANYAHIEAGTVTGVYDTIPTNWRNVSNLSAMKDDTEFLQSLGWVEIVKTDVQFNRDTQRLGNPTYEVVNGSVVETIEIIDIPQVTSVELTEEETNRIHAEMHETAMKKLRNTRDVLLTQSDYTQLSDIVAKNGVELTQEFVTYRQALRDLPAMYENDSSFINETTAVFPTLPVAKVVEAPIEETPLEMPGVI